MKKLLIAVMVFATSAAFSQSPVTWTYTAKKIADKQYEISIVATIQTGWHLYSQTQPVDAISNPTKIIFKNNPLIVKDGKVKEVGKMEVYKDKTLGVSANQYSGKVTFIQNVKLKANVKTNVVGTVEYEVCNDSKCLPLKKNTFTIALQ